MKSSIDVARADIGVGTSDDDGLETLFVAAARVTVGRDAATQVESSLAAADSSDAAMQTEAEVAPKRKKPKDKSEGVGNERAELFKIYDSDDDNMSYSTEVEADEMPEG